MKAFLKKTITKFPALNSLVRGYLADRRTAAAKRVLIEGQLFPKILDAIVSDYRYSILDTHRNVLQLTNIEEVIQYIKEKKIRGAFVECGVYTGGASSFAMHSIMRNEPDGEPREYYGFDSFEGMPQPTVHDGAHGISWMYGKEEADEKEIAGELVGSDLNLADYDACLARLKGTGYPEDKIHLVKGWFQDVLPDYKNKIGDIAVLRIDGDFYESTKAPLEILFDNIVKGGVVIIDDYGAFPGCRKAVDDFLRARGIDPYIHYVDYGIRFFIKP